MLLSHFRGEPVKQNKAGSKSSCIWICISGFIKMGLSQKDDQSPGHTEYLVLLVLKLLPQKYFMGMCNWSRDVSSSVEEDHFLPLLFPSFFFPQSSYWAWSAQGLVQPNMRWISKLRLKIGFEISFTTWFLPISIFKMIIKLFRRPRSTNVPMHKLRAWLILRSGKKLLV